MRQAEIKEDMSQNGRLKVMQDDEGDIHIMIIPCIKKDPDLLAVSLEFCSSGGKSPRTRAALIQLMIAMQEDSAPLISRMTEARSREISGAMQEALVNTDYTDEILDDIALQCR